MKKIKNREIAEHLGISTAAVSLALNNRPGVSEETRRKVLAFVESNQEPTPLFSAVKNPIALIVHTKTGTIMIDKPFFSQLIESVQLTAGQFSYSVMLFHYTPSFNLTSFVNSLNSQSLSGAVIIATEMETADYEQYKKLKIPFILVDAAFDSIASNNVTIDNQRAIYRAFEYAYKLGHRKIGYLQSNSSISNFAQRIDGFYRAVRDFGTEQYEGQIISLPPDINGSCTEMEKLLRDKALNLPTIFLSDLDYIAVGAMNAFITCGYSIPDDISFIGFDNIKMAEACVPPLTTLEVHDKEMGRIAVRRLLQLIEDSSEPCMSVQLSSSLIIRNSVKSLL